MKSLAVAAAVVVSVVTTPLPAATKAERTRAAARIVSETLRRESSESIVNRRELLQPALEQVRGYKPALWHSGFFFSDIRKKWLPFEEAMHVALEQKDLKLARPWSAAAGKLVNGPATNS